MGRHLQDQAHRDEVRERPLSLPLSCCSARRLRSHGGTSSLVTGTTTSWTTTTCSERASRRRHQPTITRTYVLRLSTFAARRATETLLLEWVGAVRRGTAHEFVSYVFHAYVSAKYTAPKTPCEKNIRPSQSKSSKLTYKDCGQHLRSQQPFPSSSHISSCFKRLSSFFSLSVAEPPLACSSLIRAAGPFFFAAPASSTDTTLMASGFASSIG